ncbi:Eaa protein [Salmonella enterica]|nr:Eaa protein [Salmonella enterica]ECQ6339093.1 Eaa protein [Salmonella enterica subsp. enterica serovar Abony]EGB5718824.1 Eaa protein [Salmonella enterica subsp. enterica serovar Abony]EGP3080746.1 Eaa protein [Salmonella enterica subsp. enterica serovar Abony]EHA9696466.1 Eaa protein [Salmonella enterica subsp. enterica serovar Abony]
MTTITKERIELFIKNPLENGLTRGEQMELARIAMASLTAEPVRYLNKFSGTCVTLEQQPNAADDVAVYVPLYAAPPAQPAPVVPPAIEPDYEVIKSILPTANPDEYACCIAADMWNACRAAMLNGGKS